MDGEDADEDDRQFQINKINEEKMLENYQTNRLSENAINHRKNDDLVLADPESDEEQKKMPVSNLASAPLTQVNPSAILKQMSQE